LARYEAALKSLEEPRVFTFTYTLQQTGPRTLDQTHRVFRSGNDERDETLAVNGNRSRKPLVRIFHGRRYRYAAAVLAPKRTAYAFSYAGPHRDGKHLDYVFTLVRKGAPGPVTFTGVTVDGVTFLPQSVAFVSRAHGASGTVSFGKADRYWVARGATAQAKTPGGIAREQLAFAGWRFPKALPRSTFSVARPLPTLPPALP
ncbi:MAG TPA: hypothetical protein VGC96_03080, partial [Candidatus Elarobacter sp.]